MSSPKSTRLLDDSPRLKTKPTASESDVPLILLLSTWGLAAWLCRELWNAWNHSPNDLFGGIAFFIWLGALFFIPRRTSILWFYSGMFVLITGAALDFNSAKYLALSIFCATWIGRHVNLESLKSLQKFAISLGLIFWWSAALAWMPLTGYVLARNTELNIHHIAWVRITIAIFGSLALLASRRHLKKQARPSE